MAESQKTNPPPETKILSVDRREVTDPSRTSPNSGLADPSQAEPEVVPIEPSGQEPETGDQPFTLDEEDRPAGEPVGDEPTGDPLKDTQAAFTKTTQELAKMKKVLAAVVANTQVGGQAPQQAPPIPPEMLSPDPTEDERLDPTKYTQRMMGLAEMNRRREGMVQEMHNFVDSHPDWQDLMPTMQQIKGEDPDVYQGPGALSRLHRRAKERDELTGYREAMKGSADKAFQAGANMQKQKGGSPFVSPSGGGGGRSKSAVPPDYLQWDTDKQLQWLKDHGLYKDNM